MEGGEMLSKAALYFEVASAKFSRAERVSGVAKFTRGG
jgi:hypothetical protein